MSHVERDLPQQLCKHVERKGHDLQCLFQIITLNHNILRSSFLGLWGHMVNMAALSNLLSYTVMLPHIYSVIYGNLPMPAGSVRLRELVSGGATLFFCGAFFSTVIYTC